MPPTSMPCSNSLAPALPLQPGNIVANASNSFTRLPDTSTHTLSHTKDRFGVWSCIPESNLVQLRRRTRTCFTGVASVIKESRINNPKGTFMKCASIVKVAAAVAAVAGVVGCTDLKPIQAQIDDLKAQVAKNASDVAGAKSSADSANSAAQSAGQAASGAQSTANQALAAAHASQSCCDATNEKIDRMFKRSVSK
jgi:murein lipoprotein